ncbi:hypothetical protein GCM10022243_19420 [Saccharothrix violaceirubra]
MDGGEGSSVRGVRLLDDRELSGMRSDLTEVVEYRKSGLSLNWIVGCPLDCGYCVRRLFGNFGMKVPRAVVPKSARDVLDGFLDLGLAVPDDLRHYARAVYNPDLIDLLTRVSGSVWGRCRASCSACPVGTGRSSRCRRCR